MAKAKKTAKKQPKKEAPVRTAPVALDGVLVPGILVALKTSIEGGVHYERRDLSGDEKRKTWKTTRTMEDPEERARGAQVRNLSAGPIWRTCVPTSFGLLCRLDREAELDANIAAGREIVREFNETARFTRVGMWVLKGRIADADGEAVRAIVQEARGLIDEMNAGLDAADVAKVRAAANKARQLREMFEPDTSEQINDAITAARQAAREIVRRTKKQGEEVEKIVATLDRAEFDAARFSFLDMAEAVEPVALPSVNLQRSANLEVEVG
jgi:hypothetical protein